MDHGCCKLPVALLGSSIFVVLKNFNCNILKNEWFTLHLVFFISNYGQASALKVAYIFKVFRAQSCLILGYWFDQVTFVCKECNNLQDSKSILMIIDFKIFPIMFLGQLNFDGLSIKQLFYVYCKGKTPLFYLQCLLLLSEVGLSPENFLAICHLRVSCL